MGSELLRRAGSNLKASVSAEEKKFRESEYPGNEHLASSTFGEVENSFL